MNIPMILTRDSRDTTNMHCIKFGALIRLLPEFNALVIYGALLYCTSAASAFDVVGNPSLDLRIPRLQLAV